ncbi:phosphoribosyltransferase [Paenarthrobacter sp. UW852]|uniref:phosphoribosyltransferase n=1 Tax=Paenarthrobacter sp. UW852 TaxID=2951989 RepID=UPI00214982C4|nr:phosphoribosyltransferase [Paenarthrobacter sp. UW852]MCR1161666.1 phosphoribosyltransferase [Paenarthrobacter sp. UW852]
MSATATTAHWSGTYISEQLNVRITTDTPNSLIPVEALVGLALRRNPKRAHLLVSTVLAKHLPTEPTIATAAGRLLGLLIRDVLSHMNRGTHKTNKTAVDVDQFNTVSGIRPVVNAAAQQLDRLLRQASSGTGSSPLGDDRNPRIQEAQALCALLENHATDLTDIATIGYAETATGLGQLVAEQLGSYYIHSTRETDATYGARQYGSFEEAHSHATSHRLLPSDHDVLSLAGTVVLVDDELSTGATIINTIRELHQTAVHRHYVVASLIDLRSPHDRKKFDALATEINATIDVVALATGTIHLPEDLAEAAADLIHTFAGKPAPHQEGSIQIIDLNDAVTPIPSARFGIPGRAQVRQRDQICTALSGSLRATHAAGGRVLVLGTEEFMALPLAIAVALQEMMEAVQVRFSTSTRSPIAALDEPGYAIRSAVQFQVRQDKDAREQQRFAYNFAHDTNRFGTVIILAEPGSHATELTGPDSISEAVASTGATAVVVLLPAAQPLPTPLTGPAFGSYAPDDVRWLLKDLSLAVLEAPTREREAAIQSGKASYAESLPQEFEPSPEYQALFQDALDRSARRLAHAVGTVTQQVLKLRDQQPVLVSLARAGTPIGILMRRWAKDIHGIDLDHYAISIVRGLGIDQTALRYLAKNRDPSKVMFIDGWTGKGAITKELAAALERYAKENGTLFSPQLAVLADPGHCVQIFGTRDDFLIPSACLNSTISGLVSRTVFNTQLIHPGDFHGAKFYKHLAGSDVSDSFLTAITKHFPSVRDEILAAAPSLPSHSKDLPTADWSGWAEVQRISRDFGINHINLIKPGVGETTRVLLRRVPWKVLIRPDALKDLAHVLHLADQRGVEVIPVPDLAYSCVGLIHPIHTPGAVGSDGKAVIDL